MNEQNFDETMRTVRPLMIEYYELHSSERAKRNGEWWFQHESLAELADDIATWMDAFAVTFRRNAERFRTGRN